MEEMFKGAVLVYAMLAQAFARSNASIWCLHTIVLPAIELAKNTLVELKNSNAVVRYFVTEHRVIAFIVWALVRKKNETTRNCIVIGQVLNWALSIPLVFVDYSEVWSAVKEVM